MHLLFRSNCWKNDLQSSVKILICILNLALFSHGVLKTENVSNLQHEYCKAHPYTWTETPPSLSLSFFLSHTVHGAFHAFLKRSVKASRSTFIRYMLEHAFATAERSSAERLRRMKSSGKKIDLNKEPAANKTWSIPCVFMCRVKKWADLHLDSVLKPSIHSLREYYFSWWFVSRDRERAEVMVMQTEMNRKREGIAKDSTPGESSR